MLGVPLFPWWAMWHVVRFKRVWQWVALFISPAVLSLTGGVNCVHLGKCLSNRVLPSW